MPRSWKVSYPGISREQSAKQTSRKLKGGIHVREKVRPETTSRTPRTRGLAVQGKRKTVPITPVTARPTLQSRRSSDTPASSFANSTSKRRSTARSADDRFHRKAPRRLRSQAGLPHSVDRYVDLLRAYPVARGPRKALDRSQKNAEILTKIKHVHDASKERHGVRKIRCQLRREDGWAARYTVEQLLQGGSQGCKTTTTPDSTRPVPQTRAAGRSRLTTAINYFTYVQTATGMAYAAFVFDAPNHAICQHPPASGSSTHHSDRRQAISVHPIRRPTDRSLHQTVQDRGRQTSQSVENRRTARMVEHEMDPLVQRGPAARSNRPPSPKRKRWRAPPTKKQA